ncbi:hypothetical protein NHQ30_002158 [Ciborinia camelliae]|nr:hypothetical protein NHQ30_002158 [Ciborinia camelliae]
MSNQNELVKADEELMPQQYEVAEAHEDASAHEELVPQHEVVEAGGELSLFSELIVDLRRLIWRVIMAPETRGLTREFPYSLYTPYPITLQINHESREMTQTYYENIWDTRDAIVIWPPMLFDLSRDSLYIANDRHMSDTVRALGRNLHRIQSIALPSRIIRSVNGIPPTVIFPMPVMTYLGIWRLNHSGPKSQLSRHHDSDSNRAMPEDSTK